MTKKEYKAHKVEWQKALNEQRVVSVPSLAISKAFPTLTMRDAYIADIKAQGLGFIIPGDTIVAPF